MRLLALIAWLILIWLFPVPLSAEQIFKLSQSEVKRIAELTLWQYGYDEKRYPVVSMTLEDQDGEMFYLVDYNADGGGDFNIGSSGAYGRDCFIKIDQYRRAEFVVRLWSRPWNNPERTELGEKKYGKMIGIEQGHPLNAATRRE